MPKLNPIPYHISRSAIERYRHQVDFVSPIEAERRLRVLAADAARRPTPRWWTKAVPGPGVLFLYPRANSDICLLAKNGTVVTVFARDPRRDWGPDPRRCRGRRSRRQPPYKRPSPGSTPGGAA
jgi:hypothetical protein